MNNETEDCMSTTNKFTMAAPKGFTGYPLFGAVLFILLPIPFTLFQGPQHIMLYIISGGIAALFGWLSLYFKFYKVIVDGRSIRVQKGLLKKFSLNIENIDKVDWIISITKFGKNENITVRAGSRKFKVETLMEGSDKMITYLKDNVDEGKIHAKIRDFAN